MSDEAPELVSASTAEREVIPNAARQQADRKAEMRRSFAEAIERDRGEAKPATVEQVEPDEPAPARLDPDDARMRRELAAEREALKRSPGGQSLDVLLDRPGDALRGWIEGMRGDKFADDGEFM